MRNLALFVAAAGLLACQGSGRVEAPTDAGSRRAAQPVFSPPGDTYTTTQSVTITSATTGALLRCTTDGSVPTVDTPPCDTPVAVTSTTTLQAIATAAGYDPSPATSATYTIDAVATPTFDPTFSPDPAVTYVTSVSVTLESSTPGAVVHCTTDGSTPTADTEACASPLELTSTTTIQALATSPGHTISQVRSATYQIAPRVATPTFTPAAGTYATAQSVTVASATPGAVVRCTSDGSTPTASTPACASPTTVAVTTTLRAIATADGHSPSEVATGTYTISTAPSAAAPTFDPPAGTYAAVQSVTVSTTTPGATVRCTTNGSTPDASTPACASPIVIAATATIRAIATAADFTPSPEAAAAYVIDLPPQAAAPTFTPPPGSYASAQSVTVASATSGATLRCTTDGSDPTAATPACATPLVVSATTTVKAIATLTGYADSDVSTATYTIGAVSNATKLAAFAARRTWLAHMSVGINVFYGAVASETSSPAAGLGKIINDNPSAAVTFGRLYGATTTTLGTLPGGRFAETSFSSIGAQNSYPLDKLHAFRTALGSTFGGGLDFAAMKFCFADIDVSIAETDAVWAEYQAVMDPIEAAYPGRLVYWTVPLTTYEGANVFRERLSSYIRSKYGPTGRVFDIADFESRDTSGELILGANGLRTMNPVWHSDGSHLNAVGATYIAQAYLDFLYGVAATP